MFFVVAQQLDAPHHNELDNGYSDVGIALAQLISDFPVFKAPFMEKKVHKQRSYMRLSSMKYWLSLFISALVSSMRADYLIASPWSNLQKVWSVSSLGAIERILNMAARTHCLYPLTIVSSPASSIIIIITDVDKLH